MDELVKQRLVGSSVLALLALILIPWLFGDPQDPRESIRASFDGEPIALEAEQGAEVVLLDPSHDHGAATDARIVATPATPATPAATPRRFLSSPNSAKPKASAVPTLKPTPRPSTAASETSSWLLQLISYNNIKSADEFRAKLSKDGYVAWREEVKLKGKSYYRVRMKVRGSKAQALELKAKLEKKYRIQAKLMASQ